MVAGLSESVNPGRPWQVSPRMWDKVSMERIYVPKPNKGTCSCEHCRALCSECNPGWFMPGQPTAAAEQLGMGLLDLFEQYLIFEFWCAWNPGDLYVLAPRRRTQKAGIADWGDNLFRNAPCALLGPQGCLLGYEVRPIECAEAYSCSESYGGTSRLEICKEWQKHPQELLTVAEARGIDWIQIHGPEVVDRLIEEKRREDEERAETG